MKKKWFLIIIFILIIFGILFSYNKFIYNTSFKLDMNNIKSINITYYDYGEKEITNHEDKIKLISLLNNVKLAESNTDLCECIQNF